MPVCCVCRRTFKTLKKLYKHIKDIHQPNGPLNAYKCVETNCNRSFSTKRSYTNHFKREHTNIAISEVSNEQVAELFSQTSNEVDSPQDYETHAVNSESVAEDINSSYCNDTFSDFKKDIEVQLLKFICTLYGHASIPRNQVQKIVENLDHLIAFCLKSVQTRIVAVLQQEQNNDSLSKVTEIFNDYDDIFLQFSSEYRRFKYFEESKLLIKPKPYRVGQVIGQKKVGHKRIPVPINLYGQHISLVSTFETFFNSGNILKSILDYQKRLLEDTTDFSNFIQGKYWREKFSKDSRVLIPFFIFSDEYEAGNPLSSHSGIHKICGTYVSFPTLPPEYRSKLENIFIVLLFHASDRKKFGNWPTFRPLIEEINRIHEKGIQVNITDFKGTVFPIFALLIGDNLGIHGMCGFAESFTCNYPCHICRMKIEVIRTACIEDATLLRNVTNYQEDLDTNDLTKTGVKEICHWNRVSGFHVTENVSLEVMHDLLKGVCNYDLVLILNHLISTKVFTLSFLNSRIENHDYGPLDSANRPLAITSDELSNGSLRMTAAETFIFVCHLGLLVGDKVNDDNRFWKLYSVLRQIMDIVFAPSLTEDSIEKLDGLVEYHNWLYLDLSDGNLKNKFHHMVHYQNHLKKFGPLVHLWALRGEQKHQQSKAAAYVILSRRNVTYSLGLKHGLQVMNLLVNGFKNLVTEVSPKSFWIEKSEVEVLENLEVPDSFPSGQLLSTEWVKLQGILYAEKFIIIAEILNDTPLFLEIHSIFLSENDQVYFVCKNVNIIEFDSHVHAYKVQISDDFSVIDCEKAQIRSVCSLSTSRSGFFITLRHKW